MRVSNPRHSIRILQFSVMASFLTYVGCGSRQPPPSPATQVEGEVASIQQSVSIYESSDSTKSESGTPYQIPESGLTSSENIPEAAQEAPQEAAVQEISSISGGAPAEEEPQVQALSVPGADTVPTVEDTTGASMVPGPEQEAVSTDGTSSPVTGDNGLETTGVEPSVSTDTQGGGGASPVEDTSEGSDTGENQEEGDIDFDVNFGSNFSHPSNNEFSQNYIKNLLTVWNRLLSSFHSLSLISPVYAQLPTFSSSSPPPPIKKASRIVPVDQSTGGGKWKFQEFENKRISLTIPGSYQCEGCTYQWTIWGEALDQDVPTDNTRCMSTSKPSGTPIFVDTQNMSPNYHHCKYYFTLEITQNGLTRALTKTAEVERIRCGIGSDQSVMLCRVNRGTLIQYLQNLQNPGKLKISLYDYPFSWTQGEEEISFSLTNESGAGYASIVIDKAYLYSPNLAAGTYPWSAGSTPTTWCDQTPRSISPLSSTGTANKQCIIKFKPTRQNLPQNGPEILYLTVEYKLPLSNEVYGAETIRVALTDTFLNVEGITGELLGTWCARPDLKAAYPNAGASLVAWAKSRCDTSDNDRFSDTSLLRSQYCSPSTTGVDFNTSGVTNDLFNLWCSREDLQDVFPNGGTSLIEWAMSRCDTSDSDGFPDPSSLRSHYCD